MAFEASPLVLPAPLPARPVLSFWQIWNMCFGFLGLQFGFALQNANVSRIFQTLGAGIDEIPALWIAAPLTGLIVQPMVGYFSDRTWTILGRRRPYFLIGAVLASAALLYMPRSPNLWVAAGLLWILDASINISMEPFRAFVGDQLGVPQRAAGYAMQSFFIGIGAVVASMLPWLLAYAGISNHARTALGSAVVPDTVRFAFYIGAAVLLTAIAWTVVRTREYAPHILRAFHEDPVVSPSSAPGSAQRLRRGLVWSGASLVGLGVISILRLDRQLYLVCVGALFWGVALLAHGSSNKSGLFTDIMNDIEAMPTTMRKLAPVQFFSWLALFSMWIYTTAAVAQVYFGSSDPQSDAYNEGANWVGVLFGAYNGFAALAAAVIPLMVRRLGLRLTHLINVWLGAAALLSFLVIRNPHWLLLSMLGMGFAWASILSLPYALLSNSVPTSKMGLYMGIFNFFIVIPQLVAASVLGVLLKSIFAGEVIWALAIGGASFIVAGALVLRVPKPLSELNA